jgi:hypothetical protein
MYDPQLPTQTNNYDCDLFVLAPQRATQHWLHTYLPSQRTPMNLRLTTLQATIRKVTQTQVTDLRK